MSQQIQRAILVFLTLGPIFTYFSVKMTIGYKTLCAVDVFSRQMQSGSVKITSTNRGAAFCNRQARTVI